jgi:hypothetical protein
MEVLKATIIEPIRKEKAEAIKKRNEYMDLYQKQKKSHGPSSKAALNAERKFMSAKVKIEMLDFELTRTPVFHPSNKIIAIKLDNEEIDEARRWKYNVVFEASNEEYYEAPVAKQWLIENLDPMYLNDMKKYFGARKYLLYDDLGSILIDDFKKIDFLPRDSANRNLCKNIYEYKPKKYDEKVISIRAVVSLSEPGEQVKNLDWNEERWSIYVEDKKSKNPVNHKYTEVQADKLLDIVDSAMYEQMRTDIVVWFGIDYYHRKQDPNNHTFPRESTLHPNKQSERYIDYLDREEQNSKFEYDGDGRCTRSPYGYENTMIPYYWNVEKKEFFVIKSKTQISGIRYCNTKKVFYGLETDAQSQTTSHVLLQESWVVENFDKEIIEKIKEEGKVADRRKLFYKVPIGSSHGMIHNNVKYKHNPPIAYPQGSGEESCCF